MAGDKLPLTNDPLPNIQTNKAGFGTDLTVGDKYENLINIKGAKFLDLYRGSIKIDDADDLKEALKSYDVEMSIAFNDNPDNDEFRKAYIVVITNLTEKDTTTTPEPTSGAVTFDKNEKNPGTIKGAKVETLANGNSYVTFTVVKPEWAAVPGATPAANAVVEMNYDVYVDGELYAYGNSKLGNAAYTAWNAASSSALVGNNAADPDEATEFTITNFQIPISVLPTSVAAGKTVSVVLKNVDWKAAVVEYKLGSQTIDAIAAEYLATATAGTALNISGYTNPAYDGTAGYTITGAATAATDKLTSADLASDGNLTRLYAVGGEKVVVTITGLTKNEKVSATTETYTSSKGLFAATTATVGDILNKQTGTTDYTNIAGTFSLTITPVDAGESLTVDANGQLVGELTSGNQYSIKGTYTTGATDGWDQFIVEITVKQGDKVLATVSKTFDAGTTGNTDESRVFDVTGDITVDVKVTPQKAAALDTVKYDKDAKTLTLTYTKNIDASSVVTSSFDCANATKISKIEVSGKSIILTVEGIADTDTIKPNESTNVAVADQILDTDGIPVDNTNFATFSVDANGVVTVAKT